MNERAYNMDNREYSKALKQYPMALKVTEVAEILRISTSLVYRMINENQLVAVKVGREKRVPKTELICFIRTGCCSHSNPNSNLLQQSSNNSWTSEKLCDICVVAAER